ncbi:DNA alkylation repair protein [Proteiniclasticum sp. BAD-10]|uniref:DNA alkylation repair protein n=1 Tax=Proteiniclasticum sediminis TaxID=2804028 RepID=A0A941CN45_9CLOT|nr:DNA alkylation repair protein [Proteiniclasticum sediminis]MBR0575735.1 DNA alkylation repair protein [Proteiniclasticum sediminis]
MTILKLMENLKNARHPENIPAMERYMRDQFPYLGIKSPEMKLILKAFFQSGYRFKLEDAETLYQQREREYKYAACALLQRFQEELSSKDLDRILTLALTEPWWDTIDSIAPSVLGPMALREDAVRDRLRALALADSIWEKRIAILFQLKYKTNLDEALLEEILGKTRGTGEFFVDKAMGWILREYSKTRPEFVRDFLSRYPVSRLTEKEGSKYL